MYQRISLAPAHINLHLTSHHLAVPSHSCHVSMYRVHKLPDRLEGRTDELEGLELLREGFRFRWDDQGNGARVGGYIRTAGSPVVSALLGYCGKASVGHEIRQAKYRLGEACVDQTRDLSMLNFISS